MIQNIGVLLITSKFKALNDAKQPHYDIWNKALHYFCKVNPLTIGSNTKQYHPRGANPPIWTRNDTKYWCFVNNSSIQTFWLDKTAKRTLLKWIMTVSLQNRLPNSREHPCLWPPWGVKFNYFDQKWPEIDLFLLITLKYEALNDTKQPYYDIYNKAL